MTGNINKNIGLLVIGFTLLATGAFAQIESEAVRLTGIVVDADTRKEIPYTSIHIEGTQYGTSTDNTGYFTLFMNPGDTITFTSIGFQDAAFILPYNVEAKTYSLVQLMRKETLLLEEVVVFPWPTLKNFERAFLDTEPKKDVMDEMVREVQLNVRKQADDSKQNEYYYDQMRYQRLYELHGTTRPNNFLNPMRWSNFIKDVRQGKFKEDNK